jgi:CheY-like chemotaxis protein
MLVLFVEDERELRELGQLVLEGAGMLVVTASDGERALDLLDRLKPEVLVTDMTMPVLDGLSFLEAYFARPEHSAPVVCVSAFESSLATAMSAGAAAVLVKPYSAPALVDTVRRVASGTSAQPPAGGGMAAA